MNMLMTAVNTTEAGVLIPLGRDHYEVVSC